MVQDPEKGTPDGAEEYKAPDLRYEGPEEDPQPVPETATKRVEIAQDAAVKLNKLHDLETLSRELGVADDPEERGKMEVARQLIYADADKKESTSRLVSSVIAEDMMDRARSAVQNEKDMKAVSTGEGKVYADLMQPNRIIKENLLGQTNEAKYPQLVSAAKILERANTSEFREAQMEGVNEFYEKMTGEPLADLRAAYNQAVESIAKIHTAYEQNQTENRQALHGKYMDLEKRRYELAKVNKLKTKDPHIVLPFNLYDHEDMVRYYYEGAPDDAVDASQFLADLKAISTEADATLKPDKAAEAESEDLEKTEGVQQGAESAQPAEKPKNFWQRMLNR